MWHSASQENHIASLKLNFPMPITLDRIKIYSQHSGKHHAVKGVKVSTIDESEKLTEIVDSNVAAPDGEIRFEPSTSQKWELSFRAGRSKTVVIRGLRFFLGDQEFFPPLAPCDAER